MLPEPDDHPELDKELAKIIKFFMAKEAETLGKLEQLELEVGVDVSVYPMGGSARHGEWRQSQGTKLITTCCF